MLDNINMALTTNLHQLMDKLHVCLTLNKNNNKYKHKHNNNKYKHNHKLQQLLPKLLDILYMLVKYMVN